MNTHDLPMLRDHHSHPLLYAAFTSAADLSSVRSLAQACDAINDASKDQPEITVGHGWKDNFFSIDATTLESLPPCAIFNLSLHNLVLNDAGREVLKKHYGAVIDKVSDRDWYESNLRVVLNWFAKLNGSPEALVKFYASLESLGVHSAEEMLLVDAQEIDWFRTSGLIDRTKFWAAPDTFENLTSAHRDAVAGLKLFTDGAVGAWTAAMSQPFRDPNHSNNFGMLIYTDSELATIISQCAEFANNEKGIAIHAIGDRAIEQTIKILESLASVRQRFSTIRMEHAQFISLEQARRAKDIGIVMSMQPNFNIDSVDYADRLPDGWAELNNPFRMLIDQSGFVPGVDLILGSDGMPHGVEYAALQSFHPAFESQKLTRDEFVAGYC